MTHTNVNKSANVMQAFTAKGPLDKSQVRYMGGDTLFDGAGGIKSTMSDMLKFANAEVGIDKTVPPNLRQAMIDTQKIQCSIQAGSAYGAPAPVNCNPRSGAQAVKTVAMDWEAKMPNRLSHTGSVPGYKSYLILDTSQSSPLAAVAFTNVDRPDASAMLRFNESLVNLYKFCRTTVGN